MKITIENNDITALFDSKGAELCSLKSIGSHREFMWNGNPEFWGKHAPVLFTIVGTVKDNQYR